MIAHAQDGARFTATMEPGNVRALPARDGGLLVRRRKTTIETFRAEDVLRQGLSLEGAWIEASNQNDDDERNTIGVALPSPFDGAELRVLAPRVVASQTAKMSLLFGLGIFALGVLMSAWGVIHARRAQQLQADFVASVSHEMKTPIASVRAMAEFMEDGRGCAATHAHVRKAHREGDDAPWRERARCTGRRARGAYRTLCVAAFTGKSRTSP